MRSLAVESLAGQLGNAILALGCDKLVAVVLLVRGSSHFCGGLRCRAELQVVKVNL